MAKYETISFRPRQEFGTDIEAIYEWARDNGSSFGTIVNSYLPAIAYALQAQTFEDEEGNRYIRSDFGDIKLLKTGPYLRHTPRHLRK